MRTGEPNNIKHKLDELKDIPEGFQFDQHTVWQRLESRLTDQSEKRKKPYGILLFVAATALLFICLEVWVIHLFGNATQQPLAPMNSIAGVEAPQTPSNIIQENLPKPTNVISKTDHQKENTNYTNYTKDTQQLVVSVQVPPVNEPPKDTITTLAKATTALSKKGFPIAHVNELIGEQPMPLIIPGQGKTKTASLFKKKAPVIVYDAPSIDDEEINTRKKQKGSFN